MIQHVMKSYQIAVNLIVVALTTIHISCKTKGIIIKINIHTISMVLCHKFKLGLNTLQDQSRSINSHQVNDHMAHHNCQVYHQSYHVNTPMHHSTTQAFQKESPRKPITQPPQKFFVGRKATIEKAIPLLHLIPQ